MSYINEIKVADIGVEETVPMLVYFDEILSESGNTVEEARRFDLSDSTDTGTDISANASVVTDTNQMLLSNMWLGGDTPAVGKYRIQLRMAYGGSPSQSQETNLIVKVKV